MEPAIAARVRARGTELDTDDLYPSPAIIPNGGRGATLPTYQCEFESGTGSYCILRQCLWSKITTRIC